MLRGRGIFLVLLMAIVGSCTEQATGPDPRNSARILLNPQFVLTPGSSMSTLPITRIRLTARDVATNAVLEASTVAVDPDADPWEIDFSVRITAATRVIITIELIHVSDTGVESVEWSGVTEELVLTPGVAATEDMSVLPGPLDNLQVTSLSIVDVPAALLEGDGARLRAVVTAPPGVTPRVFWATSDTTVLRIDEDGDITGVRPGTARITAEAGTRRDTVDITVGARAVRLTIDPASAALDHIGAEMTFAAHVLDVRGDPVPDSPVTWSATNAEVLQHLGGGRFRALRVGTTTIQAVLTSAPTIAGNAIVIVTQGVARIVITPPVSTLDARGATLQLSAAAEDAGGAVIESPMLVWSTSDEAVAAVDQSGLVTAVGDGVATIRASSGDVSGTAEIRVARRAAQLAIFAGNGQTGAAGSELPIDPAVRVTDAAGHPMAGVSVMFTIASGGGSITGGAATTDANGVAAVGSWTLGTTAGANALNAAVEGLTPVTFTATATSGAPAVLVIHAGNNQSATVGTAVTIPPSVRVTDAFDNPVAGVTVGFAILSGGGNLTSPTTATDANGVAAVGSWTLGAAAGTNELRATADGLAPVTFTADGTRGAPAILTIHGGNDQTATVGTAVATAPSVLVTDNSGNPLGGVTVLFAVVTGGGQVTGASAVTSASGVATVGSWTLGTAPGANQLSATVTGLAPVTFNATATAGAPAKLVIRAGNGQSAPVESAVPVAPSVRVTDAHTNPVAGVTVEFAVVSGGGQVTGPSAVTGVNGVATVGSWTLGPVAGANELSATVNGLTVTFTATGTSGAPAILTIHGGNDQTATVGTAVAAAPSVLVTDNAGNPLGGVTVVFAVAAGGGQVTGESAVTAASGVATIGSWTLGTTPGVNQLTATVDGLTPVTFNATATVGAPASLTIHAGDGQSAPAGSAVPVAPAARVTDAHRNPVAGVTVVFAIVSGGGQVNGATTSTDDNGVATVTSWILGTSGGTNQLSATVNGIAPVTFTATATTATPSISLALADGHTNVGVSFTAPLRVMLSVPAPTGGVTVTVVSSNTAKLRVASPGTVTIASGATEGTIQLEGVEAGSATLTATAPGHTQADFAVTVSLRLISLPVTLNVPYGQTASLPIQLAEPAPAGGVTISLASSDETRVRVLTPTVTIAAGSTLGSATVEGTLPGNANVTANATGFIGGTSSVTTTANLDIVESVMNINASFGNDFTIRLRSAGDPIAAPAGGLQISFAAVTPLCVTVPATATIPQGLTQITVPVSYGDASLPCTTKVHATAQNILPDSVTVNVAETPALSFAVSAVGAGLQRAHTIFLNTTNHSGLTIRITSADATRLLLSSNGTTVGAGTLDVTLPAGSSGANFWSQAVGGTGQVTLTATAPQVIGATDTVDIVQPALDIAGWPSSMTTLTPDADFYVRVGLPNSINSGLIELQQVRAGSQSMVITVTSDTPSVATLRTSTGTAATRTVAIAPGQANSPVSVGTGGIAVHPVAAGTTVTHASSPGVTTTAAAVRTLTVAAPTITVSGGNVGAGLRRVNNNVSLGASAHGGVTIRVTSSDPTRLLLSSNTTNTPTEFIDVSVLNGNTSFSFVSHALEGTSGNVTVTATHEDFSTGSMTVAIVTPAIDVIAVPASMTTTTPDNSFYARLGLPNGINSGLAELQDVRTGGTGFSITFTTSSETVATLVNSAGATGPSVTVSLTNGSNTPTTVASGGVAVRPLSAGSATIAATAPGVISTGAASRDLTVTGSSITLSPGTVGSGLQRLQHGSLSGSDHGGVTVRVQSANAGHLLIAPNAGVAGSEFIDIAVPNGTTSFSYVVQAIDDLTGGIQVTASADGFSDATTTIDVVQAGLDVVSLNLSPNTLSGDDPFNVRVGIPNSNNTGLVELQNRRFGAAPLVATITSSTTAGQIVTETTAGGSGTTTIVENQSTSPFSVSSGGVAFRPFSAGTTVVAATIPGFLALPTSQQTVTVSAPSINLNASTVGGGLMKGLSGTLSSTAHGGRTIHLSSSNPSVALLSPNATTAGQAEIDIVVPNNVGSFNYYVHGVEGALATVAITATTGGFTDGSTTATIVQPGFDIVNHPTTMSTVSPPALFFVRVGLPNSNSTSLTELQAVRAGAQTLSLTVTTTDEGVARLATASSSGASVTVGIPAGSMTTTASLATGGVQLEPVSPGNVTIAASTPGYISAGGSRAVQIVPAAITVNAATVGAGLQRFTSFSLNGGNHGGIVVRLTSTDPSKLLVAPSTNTVGSAFIDINVPDGVTSFSFAIQGLEDVTGDVTVEATAGRTFVAGSAVMPVVQAAFDIVSLPTSTSVTTANIPFNVRVGIPNSLFTALVELQSVRFGSGGLTVGLTSSNPAVGQLVTERGAGGTAVVVIPANTSTSPNSVAAGGVAFDPLAAGSTTVSSTIDGLRVLPTSSVTVTVN